MSYTTISIHAPRTGSDTIAPESAIIYLYFNPRSPHGERRFVIADCAPNAAISIHAPRTGSDVLLLSHWKYCLQFQSTLPARGATTGCPPTMTTPSDFNPRSPHGERRQEARRKGVHDISIHAPRTGSDIRKIDYIIHTLISIHAPRTGSDSRAASQSRQPPAISIHAPRTGSDGVLLFRAWPVLIYFNPRSPHGERQPAQKKWRAERYFNPRSPHGERPTCAAAVFSDFSFQSTLPARGATPP